MDAVTYTDWLSPLLVMLWRPLYEIGFGIGFVLLAQITVLYGAIGALIRPLLPRQWSAILVTVAICLFPTTYAMLINVIRDTWFTVAVVGTVAVIFRTRTPSAVHGACLLAGFFAIVAARQNGVFTVIALTFVVVIQWHLVPVWRSAAARTVFLVAASFAVGALFVAGTQFLQRLANVSRTGPETATFYVDLDEMSTRVGQVLVPDVYMRRPLSLADLAEQRNYIVDNMKDRVKLHLPADDRSVAASAWRDAVVEHPKVYLQSRWQMFTRQIGWSGAPREAHYPTNVTSDVYPMWSSRLSELATSYLEMFDGGHWHFGGFVHRPWLYIAVSAVAGLRFGRKWPLLYAIPVVQLSVFAGLFFLSPISKIRLVYPTFVLGLVAGAYLLLGGRSLLLAQLRGDGRGTPY